LKQNSHELFFGSIAIISIVLTVGISYLYKSHKNSLSSRPERIFSFTGPSGEEISTTVPKERSSSDEELKYGAYISTPMDGFQDDAKFETHRKDILKLIDFIENESDIGAVFCALSTIENKSKFESEDIAFMLNFDRIVKSKYFILILPEKVYSSVFIEVGIAIALGKKCVFFLPKQKSTDDNAVPFLLRGISNIKAHETKFAAEFPHIFVYEESGFDSWCSKLRGLRSV
jgi:hypothetical protein